MPTFELFNCKRCGVETRRKRLAQRYCSERCRNAAVQERKRHKKSRSGDKKARTGCQKRRLVPPYREAVTAQSKNHYGSEGYDGQKGHSYPPESQDTASLLRRPVVNVTGKALSPDLLACVLRIETADYPPKTQVPQIEEHPIDAKTKAESVPGKRA
jgi:hypothetical protein